jgi:hypothetical protein
LLIRLAGTSLRSAGSGNEGKGEQMSGPRGRHSDRLDARLFLGLK